MGDVEVWIRPGWVGEMGVWGEVGELDEADDELTDAARRRGPIGIG